MQRIIEQHQDELVALCREFGVARLEVFGSAATDVFDPSRSDIDFIVEYPPDYDFGLWLDRYFALRDRLSELFGRPVDLVMAGAMRKPRFVEAANETRRVLYAS